MVLLCGLFRLVLEVVMILNFLFDFEYRITEPASKAIPEFSVLGFLKRVLVRPISQAS
jgi:hypothetical protein